MTIVVTFQCAIAALGLPTIEQFNAWATAAAPDVQNTEVVVRAVGEAESAQLNQQYRHQSGPTNVLSFPFEAPPQVNLRLLGDLVLCAPVIAQEARDQSKPEIAHWAHMVVHGMLHLRGLDHQTESQAREMESREREIMERLGYPNPYE